MGFLLVLCLLLVGASPSHLARRVEALVQLRGQALRDAVNSMANSDKTKDWETLLEQVIEIATKQGSVQHMSLASLMIEQIYGVNGHDEKGWRPLIWAIMAGDISRVEELLANGAEIFTDQQRIAGRRDVIADQQNAVWAAEFVNDGKIIEILAENSPDWYLPVAVARGYRGFIQAMLERGVDINVRDKDNYTIIMHAAKSGQIDEVKILSSGGAQIDVDVLILAIYSSNFNLVQMILEEHEVDVNALASRNASDVFQGRKPPVRTALEMALELEPSVDRQKIIRLLFNYGAELNFFAGDREQLKEKIVAGDTTAIEELDASWESYRENMLLQSALYDAISELDVARVSELIAQGGISKRLSNIDYYRLVLIVGRDYRLPSHKSKAEQSTYEIVRMLADYWQDDLPLPFAVAKGDYQLVEEHHYRIGTDWGQWYLALNFARLAGDEQMLELLLSHRQLTTKKLNFIRDGAILHGDLQLLELVLDRGADPNERAYCGNALCAAVEKYNLPAIELLLSHGADPNLVDKSRIKKLTPLIANSGLPVRTITQQERQDELAQIQIEIAEKLVAAGAEIDDVIKKNSALGQAIKSYNVTLVKALLGLGADRRHDWFVKDSLRVAEQPLEMKPRQLRKKGLTTELTDIWRDRLREIKKMFDQ